MSRERQLESALAEQQRLKSQLQAVRASFSYRLGNMLVDAILKPGRNTLLLPYRLISTSVAGFKHWRRVAAQHCTASALHRGRFTEVRLADVTLGSEVPTIVGEYAERFGGDNKNRIGGHHKSDWSRFQYISSLLPMAKSVLDVGIGTGAFLSILLSLRKFQRVVGLDVTKHSRFTMLFDRHLYDIVHASVTKLPLADKSIDVVICMEVLEHIDKQSFMAAVSELRRVAKASLIVTVPYNEPEPIYQGHKLRFTDSDLLAYFPHGEFIVLKKSTGRAWVAIVERFGVDVADGGV